MKQVYVKDNEGILLGRVGENEAVQVVWSGVAAEFESAYGKGVFMLTAQRSGDTGAYPCCVDVVDSSCIGLSERRTWHGPVMARLS